MIFFGFRSGKNGHRSSKDWNIVMSDTNFYLDEPIEQARNEFDCFFLFLFFDAKKTKIKIKNDKMFCV